MPMPLPEHFCPLFEHIAQMGSRLPSRYYTVVHLAHFQVQAWKGVFWGGVGGVLCTYFNLNETPSGQYVRKVGKSALELGKKNSIISWNLETWIFASISRYLYLYLQINIDNFGIPGQSLDSSSCHCQISWLGVVLLGQRSRKTWAYYSICIINCADRGVDRDLMRDVLTWNYD